MILPVLAGDANLVGALLVTVDANSAATGAPVKGGALLGRGRSAALALGAVPLAVLRGEDPCVGHGKDGDEGEDGAG